MGRLECLRPDLVARRLLRARPRAEGHPGQGDVGPEGQGHGHRGSDEGVCQEALRPEEGALGGQVGERESVVLGAGGLDRLVTVKVVCLTDRL